MMIMMSLLLLGAVYGALMEAYTERPVRAMSRARGRK